RNVIIVEQNPDKDSTSDLSEIHQTSWPFKIIHHFIHQTGACNARNIALVDVTSDWVFFCDDDVRFNKQLLKEGIEELYKLSQNCLTFNCKQEGEFTIYTNIKQWGSFGAGTSLVKSSYVDKCFFSESLEHS